MKIIASAPLQMKYEINLLFRIPLTVYYVAWFYFVKRICFARKGWDGDKYFWVML